MNCKITATPDFARELKKLSKRYPSMKQDYIDFLEKLDKNPLMGTKLGKPSRKVRFPIVMKDIIQIQESEYDSILRQAVVVIDRTRAMVATAVCSAIGTAHWEIGNIEIRGKSSTKK